VGERWLESRRGRLESLLHVRLQAARRFHRQLGKTARSQREMFQTQAGRLCYALQNRDAGSDGLGHEAMTILLS
jgi:hypothetical protein